MTAQIASTLGPAAVPFLQQLLRDETFLRHDNVVAFLAYLGNTASVQNLVTYGTRPAGASAAAPEQVRSSNAHVKHVVNHHHVAHDIADHE